jgi:hypothetical protein
MALAALGAAVWLVSRYEPAVEAQNKQLTTTNAELQKALQDTQLRKEAAENQLRDEKGKADDLGNQVRARTTDKQQAEGELAFTQRDLSQTRAELMRTQRRLTDEAARANDLSDRNATLTKWLAKEETERREAQRQALAAWQTVDRVQLSEKQRIEFDGIQRGVLELNDALTRVKIAPAYWPRIEGKNAVATYEIFQKAFEADQARPRGAGLFDFDVQRYTIRGDYQGRLAEELRNQISALICEAARRAIVESVSLPVAINNMPPIRGYEVDKELIATLTELQYLRMRLQIMAANALVLVRGYADGEQGPWRQTLDSSRATTVSLHENAKPNAKEIEYSLTFRPDLTQVAIGQSGPRGTTYGNDDLPNLRGQETSEIISALVGTCPQTIPNTAAGMIPVEVLQGRVYPQHSEIDRKARVHLLVFLKEP